MTAVPGVLSRLRQTSGVTVDQIGRLMGFHGAQYTSGSAAAP